MSEERIHMPTYIKERSALALVYAEDGAYFSAWRVLSSLTEAVAAHAQQVKEAQDRLLGATPVTQSPPPPSTQAPPVSDSFAERHGGSRKYMYAPPAPHRHIWHADVLNAVRTCETCGAEEPL